MLVVFERLLYQFTVLKHWGSCSIVVFTMTLTTTINFLKSVMLSQSIQPHCFPTRWFIYGNITISHDLVVHSGNHVFEQISVNKIHDSTLRRVPFGRPAERDVGKESSIIIHYGKLHSSETSIKETLTSLPTLPWFPPESMNSSAC